MSEPVTSDTRPVVHPDLVPLAAAYPVAAALPEPDRAGPLAAGLLLGLLNEAARMVGDGYATAEAVDSAVRLGCGWPVGPLAVLDAVGLPTARDLLARLAEQDDSFAPAPILGRLAAAGRGFHPGPDHRASSRATEPTAAPGCSVVVVGSGTMATGIAESFLRAGFRTALLARTRDKARVAAETVVFGLERAGVAEDELRQVLERWTATADRAVLGAADLVVEAVVEEPDVKRRLFAELGRVCAPTAVLATSTSSLSVRHCTETADRPAQVLGLHFFNPAAAMPLVELVPSGGTSAHTLARARGAVERLGKTVVECGDRTGFVVNALLFPYLNRALALLDQGAMTPSALDTAVRSLGGHPLGPVRLVDTVGADVAREVQWRLHVDPELRAAAPVPLLEALVTHRHLGRKTAGKGVRAFLASRGVATVEPVPAPA
ncbi:3-hydroxyacyl-CoA dehydrogenase family protein [Streptacidiphilus pinicola]|uniref:3-hydroxyacyl-CoA dehydrogenase family protein n=1 Tax=Streptacidiphilus pinicola TaxID=2219663 RepID=A0A2X0JZK4_9ACTN|nr:3-hydroxyacyl-CoA dehydrogenase NAD-binding domain-containing protein [Streptacidiphilus pinicola]RAG80470.1 3-hydroxyacyl-CoA dehydrogenase family protein [Streptacidiphilus pinicola]